MSKHVMLVCGSCQLMRLRCSQPNLPNKEGLGKRTSNLNAGQDDDDTPDNKANAR